MRKSGLRSHRVRGPYHQALLRLLQEKSSQKVITQESLAAVTGKEQTSIGHYLRSTGKAAPLDLDEANAALEHIGSSLRLFVDDPANVVTIQQPQMSKVQRQLASLLRGLEDDDLRIFLGLARGVRDVRHAGKQSKRPRGAD